MGPHLPGQEGADEALVRFVFAGARAKGATAAVVVEELAGLGAAGVRAGGVGGAVSEVEENLLSRGTACHGAGGVVSGRGKEGGRGG